MSTNSIDDGGAAFPARPTEHLPHGVNITTHHGMTLRDYFAAKAMQGFAADPECSWSDGLDGMARTSYQWSDAMIKARGV